MKKFKFLKKEGVKKLPKKPGVYCFKERKILYIGKASNIRKRVKNHFQQPGFKESIFLDKTKKIGFIKADSEIEALILEANLIKKFLPKYNVVWRDDKNYFYVGIAKEGFPRVFLTHQPFWESRVRNQESRTKKKKPYNSSFIIHNSKFQFIGPFVDGKALKQTLKILRKALPYRTCKILPKRPCLWYQLGRCPAPCLLKSLKESPYGDPRGGAKLSSQIPGLREKIKKECQRNARNLLKILQGKRNQVLRNLKKEMKRAADLQNFEKAAKIRDKIFSLEKVILNARLPALEVTDPGKQAKILDWPQIQKILKKILKTEKKIKRIEAYDISNISGKLAVGAMVTFIRGQAAKEFYRKFKIKISGRPSDIAMIKEILSRRLQHPEWGWPDLVLIDGGITQLNAALKIKKQKAKSKKKIIVASLAKKGNKLYIENRKRPIFLKNLPREIFNLILQLRDEAHRFAISYHRKLRKEKMLTRN